MTSFPDWNIPKHLARFDWINNPDGTTSVKVFPHDTTPNESSPSAVPFFQATFKPVPFVPYFPMSTDVFKYLGIDVSHAQPPLPQGKGSHDELPGTQQWCKILVREATRKACLGWFDLRQTDEQGERIGAHENFWPGRARWTIGLKMEEAEIDVPEPIRWDGPKSVL